METSLSQAWERLEARTDAFARRTAAAPRTEGNGRSPLRTLEHLRVSEKVYLDWIQKTGPIDCEPKRTVKYRMLVWLLRKAIPVPTPKEMEPGEPESYEAVMSQWQRDRRQLKELLLNAPPEQAVMSHPIIGPMSAEQIIEVFEAHLVYHDKRLRS